MIKLPKFNELKEEKEFLLDVDVILEHLSEEEKIEMGGVFSSSERADWRKNKENKILDLLKNNKSLDDLHLNNPITLGLDKKNELSINDGFTRIKVAPKLGIKKIKVILARAE